MSDVGFFSHCAWSAHGSSICAHDNITEGGPATNLRKASPPLYMHWFCAWLNMPAGILITALGSASGDTSRAYFMTFIVSSSGSAFAKHGHCARFHSHAPSPSRRNIGYTLQRQESLDDDRDAGIDAHGHIAGRVICSRGEVISVLARCSPGLPPTACYAARMSTRSSFGKGKP